MIHAFNEVRDNPSVAVLAGVGAAEGAWKYYVRPNLTAAKGWGAIAGAVIAYELACPNGETLSEGADRALESHKLLTLGLIGVTALHLANMLPERVDPFSYGLKLIKGVGLSELASV